MKHKNASDLTVTAAHDGGQTVTIKAEHDHTGTYGGFVYLHQEQARELLAQLKAIFGEVSR